VLMGGGGIFKQKPFRPKRRRNPAPRPAIFRPVPYHMADVARTISTTSLPSAGSENEEEELREIDAALEASRRAPSEPASAARRRSPGAAEDHSLRQALHRVQARREHEPPTATGWADGGRTAGLPRKTRITRNELRSRFRVIRVFRGGIRFEWVQRAGPRWPRRQTERQAGDRAESTSPRRRESPRSACPSEKSWPSTARTFRRSAASIIRTSSEPCRVRNRRDSGVQGGARHVLHSCSRWRPRRRSSGRCGNTAGRAAG